MHSMWYYYSSHHRWSGVDHLWVRHLEVMWITTQRDVTLSTHIDSCTIWYAIGVGRVYYTWSATARRGSHVYTHWYYCGHAQYHYYR